MEQKYSSLMDSQIKCDSFLESWWPNMTKGLRALTTSKERQELRAVGKRHYVKLQYLKGSSKMGLRLWNVMEQVEGYPPCGPANGYCTFSLQTLKERKLI